jgi:hypothetical protein
MKNLIYICIFFRILLIVVGIKNFKIEKKYLGQLILNSISVSLLLYLLNLL